MNTLHKPVRRLECVKCGKVYETVGSDPIRLSQPRQPHINPATGFAYEGTCPECGKGYTK
jgi:hypothetical protein